MICSKQSSHQTNYNYALKHELFSTHKLIYNKYNLGRFVKYIKTLVIDNNPILLEVF